jgi:hypothetical protein
MMIKYSSIPRDLWLIRIEELVGRPVAESELTARNWESLVREAQSSGQDPNSYVQRQAGGLVIVISPLDVYSLLHTGGPIISGPDQRAGKSGTRCAWRMFRLYSSLILYSATLAFFLLLFAAYLFAPYLADSFLHINLEGPVPVPMPLKLCIALCLLLVLLEIRNIRLAIKSGPEY